jgi:hypothetical protein
MPNDIKIYCNRCGSPLALSILAESAATPAGAYAEPCALCLRKAALEHLEAHLSRPLPPLPGAAAEPGRLVSEVLDQMGAGDTAATQVQCPREECLIRDDCRHSRPHARIALCEAGNEADRHQCPECQPVGGAQ